MEFFATVPGFYALVLLTVALYHYTSTLLKSAFERIYVHGFRVTAALSFIFTVALASAPTIPVLLAGLSDHRSGGDLGIGYLQNMFQFISVFVLAIGGFGLLTAGLLNLFVRIYPTACAI